MAVVLEQQVQQRGRGARRRELLKFRKSLPIWSQRQRLVELVASHRNVCVCSSTGSGKSTQVGSMLLDAEVAELLAEDSYMENEPYTPREVRIGARPRASTPVSSVVPTSPPRPQPGIGPTSSSSCSNQKRSTTTKRR